MKWSKRYTTLLLALLLLLGAVITRAGGWVQGGGVTQKYGYLTLSNDTSDYLQKHDLGYLTGLTWENTSTDETLGYNGDEIFGYSKFWLDNHSARTADMPLKGSMEIIHVDFSKIAHQYVTCIADHTGDNTPATFTDFGLGTAATRIFFPTEYSDDYPQFIREACNSDLPRMKFNLIFTSLIHARHGKVSDTALKDPINDTAYSALMYCMVRAIDEKEGFLRSPADTAETDWEYMKQRGQWDEIQAAFAPNKNGNMDVWNELNGDSVKKYFTECWEIAKFLSNFTYTAYSASLPWLEGVNESGQLSLSYDYSMLDEVSKKYFQAIKPEGPLSSFINDGSKLMVTATSPEEMTQIKSSAKLYLDSSVLGSNIEIAPSGLVGIKVLGFRVPTGVVNAQEDKIFIKEQIRPVGQERFAAYQQKLEITFGESSSTPGDPGKPGPPEVHVDRYKHAEQFTATYNVNLRKFDSETGMPLEGSIFDILEAFDDSQLGGTELESLENWQNESGSQFQKWEGWDYGPGHREGDFANDPCDIDNDVTNKNGLLTNAAVGDTAHTDAKSYTYMKGYCGGHPLPDTSGMDDDEAEALMEAWQREVDKCETLVSEGGFFHSETEGEAQKQMEADRDKYYIQFISLTYDYSAVEVEARDGYILHGIHTDDIPVETKTVTSSELKTYNSNGSKLSHSSNSDGDGKRYEDNLAPASVSGLERSKADTINAALMSTVSEAALLLEDGYVQSDSTKLEEDGDEYEPAAAAADISEDGEIIRDLEILATSSEAADREISVATSSNPDVDKVSLLESLFVDAKNLTESTGRFLYSPSNFFGLIRGSDDEDSRASSHPERDATSFITSIAGKVTPLEDSIVDHTFTVFDHRTEGEIHINKRDFNLDNDNSDTFDSYGQENADGSLEGAVYGLFAADDIIHPDGKTGTVYQKNDLVAVAATDRNGDASFMAFTEAPGMTYDYAQGKIVAGDGSWNTKAPKNLHQDQDAGNGHANSETEDNESYIGFDSNNNPVTLTDSESVDSTVYNKNSSNQSGIDGLTGGNETYPISNNEENNGNCWIGRPLIAADGGTQYYVKELSRSEGYELSVSGKANEVTNGKGSETKEFTIPSVQVTPVAYDQAANALYVTVKAEGVNGDIHLKTTGMTGGASFAISTMQKVQHTQEVITKEAVETPVIGERESFIYLNGKRIEASVGDSITVNGTSYTVNQVSDPEEQYVGAFPVNTKSYGTTTRTTYGVSDYDSFMTAYNNELEEKGYKAPADEAPWAKIKLAGGTDTDWIVSMTKYLTNHGLIYFNRMRIKEIVQDTGNTYAMLQYDYAKNGEVYGSIYNPDANAVLLKKDTGNGYFVYVPYLLNSPQVASHMTDDAGFVISASVRNQEVVCDTVYPDALPDSYTMRAVAPKTYWVYDGVQQKFNNDGTLATILEWKEVITQVTYERDEEVLTPVTAEYMEQYDITIPASAFADDGTVKLKIYAEDGSTFLPQINIYSSVYYSPTTADEDSYIKTVTLSYPGQDVVTDDGGTLNMPEGVLERPIRQKIKVNKDIRTLKETKQVWYCQNCGYENGADAGACEHCQTARTTEETKTIQYDHDTYSAVHADNISADRDAGSYHTAKDWLAKLLDGEIDGEEAATIPNFRFKAYLKSNLERLYRDQDGNVVWMDRNGNTMVPKYADTNGDGNYDTFTWVYDEAYEGKEIDFPEKDKVSDTGVLESANVQKIYTKVEHNTDSMTTSALANNVWDDYDTPQGGATENVGEKEGFSTSQREKTDGSAGDLSGKAVDTNAALYSYRGKNTNTNQTDRINEVQNTGYSRLLEISQSVMEDGTAAGRRAELYNYEKFFDAIAAANADIWDNDMRSTFTGSSMANYPGQHWFETFYEKYQKDDADEDHTIENTDGADQDNTAGGDRDTSFKPFRWIREHVFGNRGDYETYPAVHEGANTEANSSTSDFARANAEASDMVRQFAVKWYLEDDAAKLMTNNGVNEDIAKDSDGTIPYDEVVYDEALFHAIAKTYNYLKPFYINDLDTIYSVEWDSAENGGADNDYTTLSIDIKDNAEHYNVSTYLPYGVYVVVEQQPERRDETINDWENRSYTIEKPKEVIVPSVYDGPEANDTTDNYDEHYTYRYDMTAQDQAKAENYLIRFAEEWAQNNPQDEREYVIRAHGYHGDYEVYKYGLDIDRLTGTIEYDGGSYDYAGWRLTQDIFDPLKDYYDTKHRGETGITEIGTENGGNDSSHYLAIDKTHGLDTANGSTYDGRALERRFFYGSVSEDAGVADKVRSMTGELTAHEGKYASMLVPWTVTAPADLKQYSSADFTGYADVNERDGFYYTRLRINKVDSETGEYILHDNAIFALYAGSRYNTFEEIEADAKLIGDAAERAVFLTQFKPGDAKFYLKDTTIQGTREFLTAMGATDITPAAKGKSVVETAAGPGELCSGKVKKGTPVCVESERIMLTDETGARTGQMTVYTTINDVLVAGEKDAADKVYANQNTGYIVTPQPIGAGVYVLAEIKAPDGYARSKPVPFEVYSDKTQYYVDGDMYNKVSAVRYEENLIN